MQQLCARLLPEGSTRGAIFNIASATLGAGALGLPYAFKQSGALLTIAWLLLAAAATVYSIKLLLIISRVTSERTNTIVDSYEDLAGAIFGSWMRHLVEFLMITFCFGTAVAYCVAVGDILEPLRTLPSMPEVVRSKEHGRTIVMVSFWAVWMLPLSLLRSVNSLRFSSFLGVAAIVFLVIATIYHCFVHRFIHGWDCLEAGGEECVLPLALAKCDVEMVSSLPLIMFAFTCQVNVYDIYRELRTPTERKMLRISCFGIGGICFAVYCAMGLFGYSDFRGDVKGNILLNLQYQVGVDPIISFAFVCIALTVVVAFPLVVFPCRESIFSIIRAPADMKERDKMIEQYRSGIPESREKFIVGPGAHKTDSCFPTPPWQYPGYDERSAQDAIAEDELQQPLMHREESLILPTYPVEAEAYYIAQVPTRVYSRPPAWQHYIISLIISVGAVVIAVFVPKIQVIFSLLGGICSSFLCFIFPAICLKHLGCNTVDKQGVWGVIAVDALLWGGAVAGIFSTALTIISF